MPYKMFISGSEVHVCVRSKCVYDALERYITKRGLPLSYYY